MSEELREKIARLRELLAKATPGEWAADEWGYTIYPAETPKDKFGTENIAHLNDGEYIENVRAADDAELIVAMRNLLPALIDHLEADGGLIREANDILLMPDYSQKAHQDIIRRLLSALPVLGVGR